MNQAATLKVSSGFPSQPGGQGERGGPSAPHGTRRVGLWVFMVVVAALFMLFGIAYVMRMAYGDWRAIHYVPWQLWSSTALLALGSLAWERAWRQARQGRRTAARQACGGALGLALAFVVSQLAAWQALLSQDYGVAGNPANSFFYLITGLHGLHVIGGVLAGGVVSSGFVRGQATDRIGHGMHLCAQYWHFLFALWLAVFALLFYLTPELVKAFCETVGIPVR
jgi:cytochrome c oxidase subunit 3